jgi:hypothetical protein
VIFILNPYKLFTYIKIVFKIQSKNQAYHTFSGFAHGPAKIGFRGEKGEKGDAKTAISPNPF